MSVRKAAAAVVAMSALAGIVAGRGLDVRIAPRAAATVDARPFRSAAGETVPLPMRLVDAGGVGIVADSASWGTSYSHGTGAFHSLIPPGELGIDREAFSRIRRDWRVYIDRMAGYGNNGVVVGAFLELIDFDRIGDGAQVYARDSDFRRRHEALRVAFGQLFDDAHAVGLGVYLKTDMLALTPPLERMLRGANAALDTDDPALWRLYAAGIEELFERMPAVRGVIIRIGEAGALYDDDGWPYRSAMAVRTPSQLQQMLTTLLPVFERNDRELILRSWTVGIGPLGDLHTDPAVYDAVLGDIASPNLVVSTKYTMGDYFGFLPLNPTLLSGRHRRLIEFQARREFEGFSAFPNFLGGEHAHAINALTRANPNIVGISLWTQEGGPLKAGPMSLYPVHGFWRWIDANVYATSRLAHDPGVDPAGLAADWVRETISSDPTVVAGLTRVLLRSRAAVENALYVRPFAERDVRVAGIASTPMMWIMEWDVVGDWSAVSSTVYEASRGGVDEAVEDGFAAAREATAMRRTLEALRPRLAHVADYDAMLRSLAYEESLFSALAWYRQAFLAYYRWLDTGAADAHELWQESAARFRSAAAAHAGEYGRDLDFPAYDFAPALDGLQRAERSALARTVARASLAVLALLLLAGTPLVGRALPVRAGGPFRLGHAIRASHAPWLVGRLDAPHATAWLLGALTLVMCTLTVSIVFAFGARPLTIGLVVLLTTFAVALKSAWSGLLPSVRDGHAIAALAPLLLGALATLAIIAVRGPDHFWFRFWSDAAFRSVTVAVATGVALWTTVAAHVTGRAVGVGRAGAAGSTLVAVGSSLVMLSILLPDLPALLATLDAPLAILPVRFALVVAMTSYADLPAAAPWYPAMAGVPLVAAGVALRRLDRYGGADASLSRTSASRPEWPSPERRPRSWSRSRAGRG